PPLHDRNRRRRTPRCSPLTQRRGRLGLLPLAIDLQPEALHVLEEAGHQRIGRRSCALGHDVVIGHTGEKLRERAWIGERIYALGQMAPLAGRALTAAAIVWARASGAVERVRGASDRFVGAALGAALTAGERSRLGIALYDVSRR